MKQFDNPPKATPLEQEELDGLNIKSITTRGELEQKSNMQTMHIPNSDKPISLLNLEE